MVKTDDTALLMYPSFSGQACPYSGIDKMKTEKKKKQVSAVTVDLACQQAFRGGSRSVPGGCLLVGYD